MTPDENIQRAAEKYSKELFTMIAWIDSAKSKEAEIYWKRKFEENEKTGR